MKKLVLLLSVLLFFTIHLQAQSIYLKVKKGSAKLNGVTISSKDAVKTLSSNAKLMVSSQSIVVLKQNKKFVQLAENKTYLGLDNTRRYVIQFGRATWQCTNAII